MKICKIFLCVVCTIAIGTCSSTISIGESQNSAVKSADPSGSSGGNSENIRNTGANSKTASEAKNAAISNTNDSGIFVNPKYNCDPRMLLPGNPDIDPKFLVKPRLNR